DLGKPWGHDGALRASQLVLHTTAWGVDPRFQHPRNQPPTLGVRAPLSQASSDLLRRHRGEKLGQIQLYDPVDGVPHALVVEPAQGIMTAAHRAHAIRARE